MPAAGPPATRQGDPRSAYLGASPSGASLHHQEEAVLPGGGTDVGHQDTRTGQAGTVSGPQAPELHVSSGYET